MPSHFPAKLSVDKAGNIIQHLPHQQVQVVGQTIETFPLKATSTIRLIGNLSASESVRGPLSIAQFLTEPNSLDHTQFSLGVRVFDSLGMGHDLTVYFRKTTQKSWQYLVMAVASEVLVSTGYSDARTRNALVAEGVIGFTSNGLLDTESQTTYFNLTQTGIDFTNGAATQQRIAVDFGTSITTEGGMGTDGMLQQFSSSVLLEISQDGFSQGTLQTVFVEDNGAIVGGYSNGMTKVVGQAIRPLVQAQNTPKQKPRRKHRKHSSGAPSSSLVEIPDTMNVKQDGVWTVGQFGSWQVNVDSSVEHPVVVKDVALSRKVPWAYTQSFQFQPNSSSTDNLVVTVPPGNRLFIHHVSFQSMASGDSDRMKDSQVIASLHATFNDLPIVHQLGLSDIFRVDKGSHHEFRYILSKPLQLYADPHTEVRIVIERNFEGKEQAGIASLTGVLEQVP